MSLVELLRQNHPLANANLEDIPIEFFNVAGENASVIRNSVARTLVNYWLKDIPELTIDRNYEVFGKRKISYNNGITISENGRTILQYDFLIWQAEFPVVVKVRSAMLKDMDKYSDTLRIARNVFGNDTQLLVFAPFEGEYPHMSDIDAMAITCIDLRYQKRDLDELQERIILRNRSYFE